MERFLFYVLAVLFLVGGSVLPAFSQETLKTNQGQELPSPKGIPNLLFYVQRDPNTNTILYELNLDSKGGLNEEEPVKIYWIRYADGGKKQDLNFVQRKFAYGLDVRKISADKYELTFVSYGKRTFYLQKGPDGKFHVYASINKKQAVLDRVFVRIEGGSFWVPNVVYAEFKGRDTATGKEIVERFKP
ncbi:DUF4833 domain-containing protein [Rufibacter hautae]|uniref:DUF4833 domain-containing protein n=1 Tax=Rufibacter hautae TaxID=2595005 RepID=A0A5B6TLH0_9BACT|nr:DUF4833 domain-containing protein [Rufibacter hautae]KAA3436942.1 DUF4833 domain-containing protein [Rufibacter hautae]